ncbi:class I SAM-dependent methyltransferase [Paraburkholderia sediminicola]|uniref:class I SAM-dependent methyltransferase n=1 Tax=Paraburkholderia sediminicola TaxID=458836 RepID=UPI0038B6F4FC
MNSEIKRLAIEMVSPANGALPPLIDDVSLQRIATLLQTSSSIVVVDLGVHATPTSHPSLSRFTQLVGTILRERGGRIVVWCDASTDRAILTALAPSACPIITMALPCADKAEVKSLNRCAGFLTEDDLGTDDPYALGVPLAARPDAPSLVPLPSVHGGCPIVEQGVRYFDTDGREFACHRLLRNREALAAQSKEQPVAEITDDQRHALRHALRLDQREQATKSCAGCNFSYQGWLDDNALRTFWLAKDDCGELVDTAEREHLFGKAIPTAQRVVKVDLGCGPVKRPGFIGIDRFPLPGVDIATDINKGIPLPQDSVDYLVASHSLEHFDDLPNVIHEIHRVCKDRALVTIVAPYSATALNLANPYHVQVFNEHTARFFSNAAETSLDAADYNFPSAKNWGLASSDHSNWLADLRLLKCEFFYMPPYRGLDDRAKRVLRQSLNDVCEQMLLQMLVVKSPISPAEFSERVRTTIYQEPPLVTARRAEEAQAGEANMFTALAELPKSVSELSETVAHWRPQIERMETDARGASQRMGALDAELVALNKRLDRVERTVVDNHQAIEADGMLLAKRVTAVNAELIRRDQQQKARLDELEKTVASLRQHLKKQGSEPAEEVQIGEVGSDARPELPVVETVVDKRSSVQRQAVHEALSREGAGEPLGRAIRLYRRRAQNLTSLIAPRFNSLKQFGERHGWIAQGLRLQESNLWRSGQEWIYDLPVENGSLAGLRLGVTTQFKPSASTPLFDCAVWSADSNSVLVHAKLTSRGDLSVEPIEIAFPPIDVARGFVRIRLLALPAVESLGIRTIEWRGLNVLRQVRKIHLFCEPIYR